MTGRLTLLLSILVFSGACQVPRKSGPRKLNYREAIARKAVRGLMENRDRFERGAHIAIDLRDESRRGIDLDGIRARMENELYRTQLFKLTSQEPPLKDDFRGRRKPGGWTPPDGYLRGVVRPSSTEKESFVITIEVRPDFGAAFWTSEYSFRIY